MSMTTIRQCPTHGTETANCGPLCPVMFAAPPPRVRRYVTVKAGVPTATPAVVEVKRPRDASEDHDHGDEG